MIIVQKRLAGETGLEPVMAVLETAALAARRHSLKMAPADGIEPPLTEVHNLPLYH